MHGLRPPAEESPHRSTASHQMERSERCTAYRITVVPHNFNDFLVNVILYLWVEAKKTYGCCHGGCRCFYGEKVLGQHVQLDEANAQTMSRKQHRKHVPHLACQGRVNLRFYCLTLLLTSSLSFNLNLLSSSLALTSKLNTSFLSILFAVISPFNSAFRSAIIPDM